jgi:hypothetical protein
MSLIPTISLKLRTGGRLATVAGQFVKNEAANEFAALLAAPFGQRIESCDFALAELRRYICQPK